jgi:hypothetical protein
MKHPNDVDALFEREVEDHVLTDGEGTQSVAKFRTCSACQRHFSETREQVLDPSQHTVSGAGAVVGDPFPYLDQVEPRSRPEADRRHYSAAAPGLR